MKDPVLIAQLDALDAQIELLKVQAQGIRHRVTQGDTAPRATQSLPQRCTGIREDRCALQDDNAQQPRASFADPNAWVCIGCRWHETRAAQPTGE